MLRGDSLSHPGDGAEVAGTEGAGLNEQPGDRPTGDTRARAGQRGDRPAPTQQSTASQQPARGRRPRAQKRRQGIQAGITRDRYGRARPARHWLVEKSAGRNPSDPETIAARYCCGTPPLSRTSDPGGARPETRSPGGPARKGRPRQLKLRHPLLCHATPEVPPAGGLGPRRVPNRRELTQGQCQSPPAAPSARQRPRRDREGPSNAPCRTGAERFGSPAARRRAIPGTEPEE